MAKIVSIEVIGTEKVINKLRSVGKNVDGIINKSLFRSALLMEGEIKLSIAGQRAEVKSVDTGRFLNSVAPGKRTKDSINVESKVKYAGALEFGTSKTAPRSHFRNSLARNRNKIVKQFIRDISTFSKL